MISAEPEGNNVEGVLVIKQPWPSIARSVYNDHNRYLETKVTSGSRAVLMSTILAHRTAPSWSLPSNLTLRVHPGLTYIKIHDEEHDFEYFTQQYEDRAFRVFASLQEIFAADSTSDADSSALASASEKGGDGSC
ncbi:hypothetical protein EDD22DRAFT_961667 [Suillus occidentalis]|nr:hypothetical protein EDD22DRAFT_961667 [Suillus occidentalis]